MIFIWRPNFTTTSCLRDCDIVKSSPIFITSSITHQSRQELRHTQPGQPGRRRNGPRSKHVTDKITTYTYYSKGAHCKDLHLVGGGELGDVALELGDPGQRRHGLQVHRHDLHLLPLLLRPLRSQHHHHLNFELRKLLFQTFPAFPILKLL